MHEGCRHWRVYVDAEPSAFAWSSRGSIEEEPAMSVKVEHPSVDERRARGKEASNRLPASGHAGWEPAAGRPDPVALLEEQNAPREPDLVPVRHGRMMVSPFTFYRGAAKIMAADLKDTPTAGLDRAAVRRRPPVQLRGVRLPRAATDVRPQRLRRDPARALRVRREAAGGELHDRRAQQRVRQGRCPGRVTPRQSLPTARRWPSFAQMRTLDIWYAHLAEDDILAAVQRPEPRPRSGEGAGEGDQARQEEHGQGPDAGTACRHCPSSPSW